MSKDDYRNTDYCPSLDNICYKKLKLRKKIISQHSRCRNFYSFVSKESGSYKGDFLKIYNEKCAYCGNSIENLTMDQFEIDHFVDRSCFGSNHIGAGKMKNLVASCRTCNRLKSDFPIRGKYKVLFDAYSGLPRIFERLDDFSIAIRTEFQNDTIINSFYSQLGFDRQFRRIDFLLLTLRGMVHDPELSKQKSELCDILLNLQEKRNKVK